MASLYHTIYRLCNTTRQTILPAKTSRTDKRSRQLLSTALLYSIVPMNNPKTFTLDEIAALAERLDKLRGQLVKRKDAKSRMVELKLEMVLSQADGLGWPDDGAARARGLSGTTDWFIQSDDVSAFPPAARYQQVLEVGPNGEEIEIVRPLLSLPASPVAPVAPAAPATPGSDPFR